jgi:hypothetical protein
MGPKECHSTKRHRAQQKPAADVEQHAQSAAAAADTTQTNGMQLRTACTYSAWTVHNSVTPKHSVSQLP